jgi:hypothetical protein
MICYRDKTFCRGNGCLKFNECPRAATKEVIEAAARCGMLISYYAEPEKLPCYASPNKGGNAEVSS